jgi:hypothetical protein
VKRTASGSPIDVQLASHQGGSLAASRDRLSRHMSMPARAARSGVGARLERVGLARVRATKEVKATKLARSVRSRSHVDRPLLQNRKTEKVVTRSVQQVAINSAIAWSDTENAVTMSVHRSFRQREARKRTELVDRAIRRFARCHCPRSAVSQASTQRMGYRHEPCRSFSVPMVKTDRCHRLPGDLCDGVSRELADTEERSA